MVYNPFSNSGQSSLKKKKRSNVYNPFDPSEEDEKPDSIFSKDYQRFRELDPGNPFDIERPVVPQTLHQPIAGAEKTTGVMGLEVAGKGWFDSVFGNPVSKFVGSAVGDALQIISTPLYGVTKFFDSILSEDDDGVNDHPYKQVTTAFGAAFKEMGKNLGDVFDQTPTKDPNGNIIFAPSKAVPQSERLSFKDILKEHAPESAAKHPIATSILGFVGDVALDPTTYISFGTSTGMKLAGQKLSNKGIDLVRGLNELVEDGFEYTIRNKQGLERVGYIGIDEIQRLSNVRDLVTLGKDSIAGDTVALGQLNTIINAQTRGFKGKLTEVRKLSPEAKAQSVEINFNRMALSDEALTISGGDVGMFLNIPFSPKRITVIPPKAVDYVLDKIGIKKISDSIEKRLLDTDTIAGDLTAAMNRKYPLSKDQEFVKIRDTLFGEQNIVNHQLKPAVAEFLSVPKKSRLKLTQEMAKLEERINVKVQAIEAQNLKNKPMTFSAWATQNPTLTKLDYDKYVSSLPRQQKLSDKVIDMTRARFLNEALATNRITQDEFNLLGKFINGHNGLAELELVSRMFHQVVDNGLLFTEKTLGKAGAKDWANTTNKGTLDLAVLYALRIKAAGYAAAQKKFDDSLKLLYGSYSPTGEFVMDIPKNVQRELNAIGTSGFSEYINNAPWVKFFERVADGVGAFNNVFKPLAYTVRFFATPKQYIGNTLQGYSKIGSAIFKSSLDPRSLIDAAVMTFDNSAYAKYVPKSLIENVQKFGTPVGKIIYAIDHNQPQFIDDYIMVNRLNEHITGPQLAQEMMRNRIYDKGLDILTLDQSRNLELELAKVNGFLSFQAEKLGQFSKGVGAGLRAMFFESIPWINLPSHMENINRAALYLNARRIGLDEANATKTVIDALFDYTHGTTQFENMFMKRLVPFYTFQRFAVPLIASLVKEPGKASNLKKITEEFLEVYGLFSQGETLTDSQRQVVPGYIIAQPHIYDGVDREGNVAKGIFRTFNSYLFTDWLSLIEVDNKGEIDFGKTVQKMTLAQITPLLKVPLERAAGKNFFTDQPLDVGGRLASGDYVQFYDKFLPDQIKDFIDYEVRVDPRTGEKQAYISPYKAYYMTAFAPFLNDYISTSRENLNPREATMKLIFGVGTKKLDFEREKHFRVKEWQKEIRELQRDLRDAIQANNKRKITDDQLQLQLLIKKMTEVQSLNVSP